MDPNAGWAGAGLLGLVLYWLLFRHIPALIAELRAELKESRAEFKAALDEVIRHCKERHQ